MYNISINSTSPDNTIKIGKNLAKLLTKGDVVVLTGDLGARKNKICRRFFV